MVLLLIFMSFNTGFRRLSSKAFLLFFLGAVSVVNASSVKVGDDSYDIELVAYEPPVRLSAGKLVGGVAAPFWYDAYRATANYKEFSSFENWIKYFSDEYIETRGMTREMYSELLAEPQSPISVIAEANRSAIYGILFKFGNREVFLLKMHDSALDKYTEDMNALGFTVTKVFEKLQGVWKNQLYEEVGLVMKFPYDDLRSIRRIMAAGAADLDKKTGAVINHIDGAAESVKAVIGNSATIDVSPTSLDAKK